MAGDPPRFVDARDEVVAELVRFCRALRRADAAVPATAAQDAARALVALGFDDKDAVRAGLRASLVARREDVPTFDRLFPAFWDRLRAVLDEAAGVRTPPDQPSMDGPDGGLADLSTDEAGLETAPEGGDGDADGDPAAVETAVGGDDAPPGTDGDLVETAAYSPVGRPSPVGVDVTGGGDDLRGAVGALLSALGGQRSRRWRRAGAEQVDARRALRRSFASGGTLLEVPRRARRRDAVRTTFLVDVSQSVLDALDRGFLVRFLRAAVADSRSARVFLFDTDVREVTAAFDAPTADAALSALEDAEATWGGGTRIGSAVGTVRSDHRDAVDRRTTVFVVSDGLERGEVEALESGMAWLASRAAAVFWLNPLAASPDYEPVARGMAASLPYVDGLFAFAGPDDVRELARQLGTHWPGDGVGYRHDRRLRQG